MASAKDPVGDGDQKRKITTNSRNQKDEIPFWRSVLSMPTAWRVFVFGIILISLPTFIKPGLANYPLTHQVLEHTIELCGKAGEALLIAVLLIVTIDEKTRLKLIEAVVRAASPKLIGQHLPDSVQAGILQYFEINFVRSHLTVDFILEPIPNQGFLKVVSRFSGPIRNCGQTAEKYTFTCMVDPSVVDPSAGESTITQAKFETEDGIVMSDLSSGAGTITKIDGATLFQQEHKLSPKVTYISTFETVEYRPVSYFMPLFTATTVVSATVSVTFPRKDFDVKLQLPTISGEDPKPVPTYSGYEWPIREPLLPGQCIPITWFPLAKPASPAGTPVPSAAQTPASTSTPSSLPPSGTPALQPGTESSSPSSRTPSLS